MHKFLKSLKSVGLPENDKKMFYAQTIEMLVEFQEEKPDFKKIREIEEKYQWPFLSKLDDPTANFYENVEDESKKAFIDLILDEKKLRLNIKSVLKADYERKIDGIIAKRAEYLAMMLNFTLEDYKNFKKSGKKWWLALAGAGAITIMGFYGVRKILGNNIKKKSESKETT